MKLPKSIKNPFRPGAGHMPPYLAGRESEINEFAKLLEQETILDNLVLTGLRGVGKTVLLETFKPLAIDQGWLWAGTDLSEAVSVNENSLALRLITDLSLVTSSFTDSERQPARIGFAPRGTSKTKLDFHNLVRLYENTPGLIADKIKQVLETAWNFLKEEQKRGLVFAYDEAQNLADRHSKDQYSLSLLLDVFQSIQRKRIPFMLILTGLPTLFPKLVESRTFAERMFRVMTLDKLNEGDSRKAIIKPIEDAKSPVTFTPESVDTITEASAGYPYFLQFICREVYDVFIQQTKAGRKPSAVPMEAIVRKLDSDFFAGRWAKPTDRQRELLRVIASLERADTEFTVQEVVTRSAQILDKPFSSSHVNQMLVSLSDQGLIFKNRYGKYSFAVPLFGRFILRQMHAESDPQPSLF